MYYSDRQGGRLSGVAVKRGSTVYSIACCVGKQVTSTYFQFKTDVADSQIFFTLGP